MHVCGPLVREGKKANMHAYYFVFIVDQGEPVAGGPLPRDGQQRPALADDCDRIRRLIGESHSGVPHSPLLRRSKLPAWRFVQAMKRLQAAGVVATETYATASRPGRVYHLADRRRGGGGV